MNLGKDFAFIATLIMRVLRILLELVNEKNEAGNGDKVEA